MITQLRVTFRPSFTYIVLLAAATPHAVLAAGAPATVAEATAVLDISTLPLAAGAEAPAHRSMASLSYEAPLAAKPAFEFHQKQLLAKAWKEMPGSYISDQSASATFMREGYRVSLSAFPASKPNSTMISLIQHGNVDFDTLPKPAGAKLLYAGPVSAMFNLEGSVADAATAVRQLLVEKGWVPYGSAGDVQFFKQNAVLLSARVAAAPAQAGKPVLDYSATLLSVDLPAPAEAEQVQYADVTKTLSFTTAADQAKVVEYYRAALGKSGWKATTENPVKTGFRHTLIFRNPAKDLITLDLQETSGRQRVSVRFEDATTVAEKLKRLDEQAARYREKMARGNKSSASTVEIAIPADARDVESNKSRIAFKADAGKAKAAATALRGQLTANGWKEEVASLDAAAGMLSFSKDGKSISVVYTDTGILPSEVTVTSFGVEFAPPAKGK